MENCSTRSSRAPKLGQCKKDFSYKDRVFFFSIQDVFSEESYGLLKEAFSDVPWVRKEESFYEQYESFVQPKDTHALASLYDPAFFFPFKETLEKNLGFPLQNKIRLAAHKLITSDAIGIHNDYTLPEMGHENVRFIFQFSEKPVDGGELSFFESKYTRKALKQFPYSKNFGVCFEITPYSFHAVAPVKEERHTLVMYLWGKGRKVNELANEVVLESYSSISQTPCT